MRFIIIFQRLTTTRLPGTITNGVETECAVCGQKIRLGIPELKLTDQGLIDATHLRKTGVMYAG